jgi:hypothetical protein
MKTIVNTTLAFAGLFVALAAPAIAKTSFPAISVSPKQFISSCQQAGGTSSGGQGSITCVDGGTTTNCDVKDGKTTDCIQVSRPNPGSNGIRNENAGGGNVSAGNSGNSGTGAGGGKSNTAAGGHAGGSSSMSSGKSGAGNTIN